MVATKAKRNWVLVTRPKGTNQRFKPAGPYVFHYKSDFGSFAKIQRDNPGFEFELVRTARKVTKFPKH